MREMSIPQIFPQCHYRSGLTSAKMKWERVIGGVKYLLICADDGVEVNGIQVDLEE